MTVTLDVPAELAERLGRSAQVEGVRLGNYPGSLLEATLPPTLSEEEGAARLAAILRAAGSILRRDPADLQRVRQAELLREEERDRRR